MGMHWFRGLLVEVHKRESYTEFANVLGHFESDKSVLLRSERRGPFTGGHHEKLHRLREEMEKGDVVDADNINETARMFNTCSA